MVCDSLKIKPMFKLVSSLNPYSIGIWSATEEDMMEELAWYSLNPYSIGIWSATDQQMDDMAYIECLNPYSIGIWSATSEFLNLSGVARKVLILILLEYGLRQCNRIE